MLTATWWNATTSTTGIGSAFIDLTITIIIFAIAVLFWCGDGRFTVRRIGHRIGESTAIRGRCSSITHQAGVNAACIRLATHVS
jgi:hypothetical protein